MDQRREGERWEEEGEEKRRGREEIHKREQRLIKEFQECGEGGTNLTHTLIGSIF